MLGEPLLLGMRADHQAPGDRANRYQARGVECRVNAEKYGPSAT